MTGSRVMPPPCCIASSLGHVSDPGIAGLLGHGLPAPLQSTRLRIVRLDVAGIVQIVAADPGDHVVANDDRRRRAVVEQLEIADRRAPPLAAVLHIQRHQVAVRRLEEHPLTENGNTAVGEMIAAGARPDIVPTLAPCTGIDRPYVIGHREVEDAVDLQGRALDDASPTRAAGILRYTQARLSAPTFVSLIFVSGLKRRPEKSPL